MVTIVSAIIYVHSVSDSSWKCFFLGVLLFIVVDICVLEVLLSESH